MTHVRTKVRTIEWTARTALAPNNRLFYNIFRGDEVSGMEIWAEDGEDFFLFSGSSQVVGGPFNSILTALYHAIEVWNSEHGRASGSTRERTANALRPAIGSVSA